MKKIALVMSVTFILAVIMAACAKQYKETERELKQPINCATADADIRSLYHEKAHLKQKIEMGVTAIVPVGAVVGLVTGTEGTKYKVATGEYNKMIDRRIAEIRATCGESPEMVFYSIDVDMDGRISREELCAFYTSGAVCAEKFTYIDRNGNGYIIESEFVERYR